jgi:pimeloyl-ACP methyl ester carboxylesterase
MAGETVVLLHSSGSSPRQWSALADRLSGRMQMRVLAPEVAGLPTLAADVEASFRGLPAAGGLHLVGHSHGGAVAVKAALSGRFDVRSVTVYEPSFFAFLEDTRAEPKEVGRAITRLLRDGLVEESARLYVDYWTATGEFDRMSPEKRARMMARMGSVVNCFAALVDDAARLADLSRLRMPWLAMAGRRSPMPSQDLCEMIAGSVLFGRLHHFAKLGHMGPVTHAEAVNAVIEEFITEVATARVPAAERRAA